MMFHAQALVVTDHPSQVAAHVTAELGLEFTSEWSAEAGTVELPGLPVRGDHHRVLVSQ